MPWSVTSGAAVYARDWHVTHEDLPASLVKRMSCLNVMTQLLCADVVGSTEGKTW